MTDPVKPVDNVKLNEQANETAKKRVAEGKEKVALADAQRAALAKSKPTPTQEENDIACAGGHNAELEDDGSGPETAQARAVEAGKAGGYQTRASAPQSHQAPRAKSE